MHIKTSEIFVEYTLQSISSLSMTIQEPRKTKQFLTNKTSTMTKTHIRVKEKIWIHSARVRLNLECSFTRLTVATGTVDLILHTEYDTNTSRHLE